LLMSAACAALAFGSTARLSCALIVFWACDWRAARSELNFASWAAVAFEQALKLEDSLAARHIAYAKVQEKLGNAKLMMQELEKAVDLEPNPETYGLLIKVYEAVGDQAAADVLKSKLNKLIMPAGKPRRVLRPRKVVV